MFGGMNEKTNEENFSWPISAVPDFLFRLFSISLYSLGGHPPVTGK